MIQARFKQKRRKTSQIHGREIHKKSLSHTQMHTHIPPTSNTHKHSHTHTHRHTHTPPPPHTPPHPHTHKHTHTHTHTHTLTHPTTTSAQTCKHKTAKPCLLSLSNTHT